MSPADLRDSAWGAPASCSTPASQVGRTRQSSRSSSRDLANALAAGPRDERGTRDPDPSRSDRDGTLAELQRRRPRSETLERLERQLVLPLPGLVPTKGEGEAPKPKAQPVRPRRSRKGQHPGRAVFPAWLPRVEIKNAVSSELRMCPLCGTEMTTVGHSRCEVLNVIPARIVVEVRLDERVACPKDDMIVSAPTPPAIVERGKLGDTLIVEATSDKYLEHTPVERQCTRFKREGVDVSPQTLRRSVAAHINLLKPVARLIEERTRAPGLLGTDATGIPVLDPSVVDGIRIGAMWVTAARTPSGAASGSAPDWLRAFWRDRLSIVGAGGSPRPSPYAARPAA
jgi:transposase